MVFIVAANSAHHSLETPENRKGYYEKNFLDSGPES